MTSDGSQIETAACQLRSGKLVAFPTETVYGLGASALSDAAVARVFEVKGRPRFDPLIVHIADLDLLDRVVTSVPEAARKLMERFWPGPLSIVLQKNSQISDLVSAGTETVAVRMPDHPMALELLRLAAIPVAAPSANPFGRISPTTIEHVREQLGGKIDGFLDGGPCRIGVESTVVRVLDDRIEVLRPGGVTFEDLRTLGLPVERAEVSIGTTPQSPGMLAQHYAPRKPLLLATDERLEDLRPNVRVGLLTLLEGPRYPEIWPPAVAAWDTLSAKGDLREAAARFFGSLRWLDASDVDVLVAEPFPDTGLGVALNDRLNRAAAGHDLGPFLRR